MLSDAGATFARGQATLAGRCRCGSRPLRVGIADQPISFDLDIVGLDPAIFDAMLGATTPSSAASIDGHSVSRGRFAAPRSSGRLSLTNGSYVSDLERVADPADGGGAGLQSHDCDDRRLFGALGNGTMQARAAWISQRLLAQRRLGLACTLRRAARSSTSVVRQAERSTLRSRSLNGRARTRCSRERNAEQRDPSLRGVHKGGAERGSLTGPPLPLAFDLQATAGKNVRVRGSGYGAGLDIGATAR